ncbi:hypothetical protein [Leifsonia poae]|uniref:Uncharacterized protein n=1 Tax=Leifsonia poae TaxID=110933 RepID=A0A9W6HAD2_9MICO|nr:hypothetical protein [Leifsonia poae]GLJ76849.1 hypothetical protein GCM10017584_24230 [Leifsonia poae]
MADLVAYTAYAHVNKHSLNEFAWDWYTRYLAANDPAGSPQQIV